jgi:hypothetical protein
MSSDKQENQPPLPTVLGAVLGVLFGCAVLADGSGLAEYAITGKVSWVPSVVVVLAYILLLDAASRREDVVGCGCECGCAVLFVFLISHVGLFILDRVR